MTEGPVRLTAWGGPGGTSAAWDPARVDALVGDLLRGGQPPEVIAGLLAADDGGAVVVTAGSADDAAIALVSSVDAFPPMVDDPADVGAVIAAHACGAVFAMGARVVSANLLLALPEELPDDVVREIAAAAQATVAAAGGALVGGHTVRAAEPVVGLAVQGVAPADGVWLMDGAAPGDALVVSKRVGTGLVLAAGTDDDRRRAVEQMRGLNRAAAESLRSWGRRVTAVTNVGRRGLAGAAWNLARRSGYAMTIDTSMVPMCRGALAIAAEVVAGTVSAPIGTEGNRALVAPHLMATASAEREAAAFDPQTSGGLLAAIEPGLALRAVDAGFVVIGEVGSGLPALSLR